MKNRSALNCFATIIATAACLQANVASAGTPKAAGSTKKSTSLGQQVLTEFDSNRNGRLESGERATATRVLAAKEVPDEARNTLRQAAVSQYDSNKSGTLDNTEIRHVLEAAATIAATAQKAAATATTSSGSALKSTITSKTSTSSTTQQPFRMRQGQANANQTFLMRFDVNGDGSLDPTEMAAAQAALAQLLAQRQNMSGANAQQMMSQLSSRSTTGSASGMGPGMMGGGGAGCPTDTDTTTDTGTTTTGTTAATASRTGARGSSTAARQGIGGQMGSRMGGGGGVGMGRMAGAGAGGMRRGR